MNHQLVEDNMNLVYFIVNRYYPNLAADEDIIQCGMIGLCKAANSWDESKAKFSTYASKAIINEICDELRVRSKNTAVCSLDDPIGDDGDTFGDFIVGDTDVPFVDLEPLYSCLTPREREVLDLANDGLSGHKIAAKLGISPQRVNTIIRNIRLRWRKVYGD